MNAEARSTPSQLPKITFVAPWYGVDIPGGMEAETRRTAERLVQAGCRVEVLTTCIRDFYADWGENYHKPGAETIGSVVVRRFKVGRRDKAAFDAVNWQLMQGRRVSVADEQVYLRQMFDCPDLYAAIRRQAAGSLFLFIPYMFATTVWGVPLAPRRSLIIPCLHEESYAYLSIYQSVLKSARALILHTQAERALADKLFGAPDDQLRPVLGEGVETEIQGDAARFRARYGPPEQFAVYVGRKEPGKNVPLLLDYWRRYAQAGEDSAELWLIGPGQAGPLPPRVRDLGFIPTQDKYDALAAADLLIMPSVHESFSLVLMESWLMGTPVLVHGGCAVTREHCRRSQGGLYFENAAEFAATLDYLLRERAVARQLGAQGRDYVLANFGWDRMIAHYLQLLGQVAEMLDP